jgi:hypothetical protein
MVGGLNLTDVDIVNDWEIANEHAKNITVRTKSRVCLYFFFNANLCCFRSPKLDPPVD